MLRKKLSRRFASVFLLGELPFLDGKPCTDKSALRSKQTVNPAKKQAKRLIFSDLLFQSLIFLLLMMPQRLVSDDDAWAAAFSRTESHPGQSRPMVWTLQSHRRISDYVNLGYDQSRANSFISAGLGFLRPSSCGHFLWLSLRYRGRWYRV